MNPDVTILAVGPNLATPQIPGADRPNIISGAELRQMMSGRLEGNTVKKLRWRQRVLLYFATPVLQRVEKPSTLRWLAGLWMPLGKKVAIVGGDFVACELAEFLASRGRNVVVLGNGTQMATEMPIPSRWRLLNSLLERRVTMLTEAKCQEITTDGLVITTKEGERQTR